MLRAIAVVVLISGLIALAVLGPNWLMSTENEDTSSTVVCDLDTGPCQWKMKGSLWVAELERGRVGDQGQEYRLQVHTGASPDRFLAVLRGESMYLGEYPVPLDHTGVDGGIDVWEATFTAPFCTTEPEMTWRIDLQQGNQPMSDLPVKMVFRAEGRQS
ncbi:MAG: hypothetical protein JJ867_04040 [Marinobacter sp.]|nr:hypothetical protein [Marinobacter sp.]